MQPITWDMLPTWALIASREMFRAATRNRRFAEILDDVLAVITGIAEYDLSPQAAIYLGDQADGPHRLIHQGATDAISFPMSIDPGDVETSQPPRWGRSCVYNIALSSPVTGMAFGTATFIGRTGRRMSAEKLSILTLLVQDIAAIIVEHRGARGNLLDLVEMSTDEIYIFHPLTLAITRANATACIRTGHEQRRLATLTPAAMKVDMSEEDYRDRIAPVVEGRCSSVSFDAAHRRRDGSTYPVTVQVWRIAGEDGDLFGEVAVAADDQQKAFSLLEQVFDSIPGGIGVFDNRSRLLMANRRLYDLMSIPPEEFPPGSRFEDILRYNAERGEYGSMDCDTMVRERVAQAELGLPYSFERERASGKVLAVRSEPLSNGGYVLSYTDITVRKKAEKDLIHSRDELEATVRQRTAEIAAQAAALEEALQKEKDINAMQRQFLTMTSHEFRTPLAIIDGAAQRIRRKRGELDPEFLADKAQQIRSAVARMVNLMESFLSAGKIDTGKLELELSDCSVVKLIEQAVKRQKLFSQHHHFETDLDALPAMVRCDALAISQVITNLLSNAVKYAPRAADIRIRGWQEEDYAFISVTDEGVGIDADDIPKLFQPYFRARTSTGIAGTGIGLSLVKQIVNLHDGDIFVESQPGKGTTFVLVLPISPPEKEISPEIAPAASAA